MTKETINSIVNNEEFDECIKDAVPLRVKIVQDLTPQMKEIKKDYENLMVEFDYKGVSSIMAKLKLDKKDETAKLDYKMWKKSIMNLFNATLKCIQSIKDDKISIGLLYKAGKMLNYIDRSDIVSKALHIDEDYQGISFKAFEDTNPNFSSDDAKNRMKFIFKDADEVQSEIVENMDTIKVDIYDRLPSDVKYDKKLNKSGIKSGNFNQIVRNKAMGILKDKDKYTKYIETQISNSNSNIDREAIVLGTTEKM